MVETARRIRWRLAGRSSVGLLVFGIALTAALSWAAFATNQHNENRLLKLQTKEAGAVLQVVIPALQTPLASAAEIAATSGDGPARFRHYIASYVGARRSFVAASLWQVNGTTTRRLAGVGTENLARTPARQSAAVIRAAHHPGLNVSGPFPGSQPRLGLAFASAGSPTYVAYAEIVLPTDRTVHTEDNSAFADLHFAIYLGHTTRTGALLETDVDQVPIAGHTERVSVPFGNGEITLVAARAGQLGGALAGALWWIVAAVGCVLTVVAALVAERLVRRRHAAEQLTGEVGRLLREQRDIAETLQHAFLPREVPSLPGVEIAARYVPGVNGVDIGGDWYDVIALDEQRFFFAVGDVSGRGVEAGAVMASLHFAIRGFVSEGYPPATVLKRLSRLLDVTRERHFATVLCGVVDPAAREVTFANAGHLPPLLLGSGEGGFVTTALGPPIGVRGGDYAPTTVRVPPGATLLVFTDGLVERRGESVEDGLDRLQGVAATQHGSLDATLGSILAELARDGGDDDTAILGVRWLT